MKRPVKKRHNTKKTKWPPRVLSANVANKIFVKLPGDWFGVMHQLALTTGMRIHEMLNCRRGLIDLDAMTIRVISKCDKERIVYLGEAIKCILENYIERCPAEKGCDLLFQRDGKGYSLCYFVRKIRTFCKRIGIKYTFHQLRRFFLINQIEAKALDNLQMMIGTDDINMFAERYVMPSSEQVLKAVKGRKGSKMAKKQRGTVGV